MAKLNGAQETFLINAENSFMNWMFRRTAFIWNRNL